MDERKRLKNTWYLMKNRCENLKDKDYKNYGARGIRVCPEWQSFDEFYAWALSSGCVRGLSLDRIDNDGMYSPFNCRWASAKEQSNNRRSNVVLSCDGETKTIAKWSNDSGIPYGALHRRIFVYGWSAENALKTPIGKRNYITFRGETLRLHEWAKRLGINYDVLEARINRNKWSVERALTQPVRTSPATKHTAT